MSKKQLTYDDRLGNPGRATKRAESGRITKKLGKNRVAIGREIKAHQRLVATSKGNRCVHYSTCTKIPECRKHCIRGKRQCQSACGRRNEGCLDYQEEFYMVYEKSPFVCNACDHRLRCRFQRMLYDTKYVQEQYELCLSESRHGISLAEEELDQINEIISPQIQQGQSLPAICSQHRAELPVTDRTIYSYIMLREKLGEAYFRTLFQVILTDRGSEFTDPVQNEADPEIGDIQCRVFYYEPMNSNQKNNCEWNHELICLKNLRRGVSTSSRSGENPVRFHYPDTGPV